jgi:hypothetical protein
MGQGYLVAEDCKWQWMAKAHRSVSDVLRQLFLDIDADPGYLATEFAERRFGSRAAMVNGAKNIFTQSWPWGEGVSYWLTGRAPGGELDGNDPTYSIRQNELQDLAEGFADAVENAQ